MSIEKPSKTPTDYLVIAVSPALIMVMVHSLCFYLIDIFYRGAAAGGVRWVLFWFVLAVVLIARIGIEQTPGYAMMYGLMLAGVTWIYLSMVQPNIIFDAALLGIVWFTAHQLTCNCTLIDDDDDASGQGLLQTLWRLPQRFQKTVPPTVEQVIKPVKTPVRNRAASLAFSTLKKEKPKSSQTPGVWLIYYSLLALPIFGLGQTLLPAGDLAARHRGFIYLFLYLTAALGLLMTTSFLGLRRYLRQRYLEMPVNIALGWVQFGVVAALLVLCATLLLPRPGGSEAWTSLRYHVDYQLSRASNFAARFNPHGSGSGRAGEQSSPNSQQPNPSAQTDQAGQNKTTGNSGDQSSGGTKSGTSGQDANQGNPGKQLPSLTPAAGSIYPVLKILFWLAVAVGFGWLLFRYRFVILAAVRSAWAAVQKFFEDWFGLSRAGKAQAMAKTGRVAPFQTFKNPFLTGSDSVWPPEKLIVYSFDALQSWLLEQQAQNGSPQTPRELCRQAGEEIPEAATELEHLGMLYGHVAYGASVPANYNPESLRLLWDWLSGPRPVRTAVAA